MPPSSAEDARRGIALIRSEYSRQNDHLRSLDAVDWRQQSFCADWKVYQVVSHLGSGAAVLAGMLRAALLEGPPMGDDARKAIWALFDSLQPEDVLAEYQRTNDQLIEVLNGLQDQQLAAEVPWVAGGQVPLARLLALRLNELTFHIWDIVVIKDAQASLSAGNVPDLLELNLSRLDVLAKPAKAGALRGETVRFDLSEPDDSVAIALSEDPPSAASRPDEGGSRLNVRTSSEVFVRLIWGRYRPPAASGRLRLDQPALEPDLIAAFPGR